MHELRAGFRLTDGRYGLSPEVSAGIANAVAGGLPPKRAAEVYGISQAKFGEYMREGEADVGRGCPDTACALLWRRVQWGRDILAKKMTALIIEQGKRDWRAAAYVLEAAIPEDYGRGDERGGVSVGVTVINDVRPDSEGNPGAPAIDAECADKGGQGR